MIISNARSQGLSRRRKGAVALELAITLPFFMAVILGIIECGQVMSDEEIIVNASREGARLASLGGSTIGSNTSTGANEVIYRVKSSLDAGAVPSTYATITVTDLDNPVTDLPQASIGDRIQVSVSVPYSKIAWSQPFYFGDAILSNSSIMRKEAP